MGVNLRFMLVVCTIICLPACNHADRSGGQTAAEAAPPTPVADKPFEAGGKINFDFDGGAYEIKPAADNHIRVVVNGALRNAKVDVTIDGDHADVKIKDTPHSNFNVTLEVPRTSDVVVRLSGGELKLGAITGNKDVESYAGNVEIAAGDPNDYSRVDAAVKAGELDARPFGGSKSGLMQDFTWSGSGKYTLRAHLGAGNLVVTGK